MFSKESDVTGAIGHPNTPAADVPVSDADLAYARAAAAAALTRGDKANSVPWRNPQTGVGGNITPLAAAHSEGGLPCREFLASYGHDGAQGWLTGSACRTSRGDWEVKSLKPLSAG